MSYAAFIDAFITPMKLLFTMRLQAVKPRAGTAL